MRRCRPPSPPPRTRRPAGGEQYVANKLRLAEVHKIATGKGVTVAVIDSAIDAAHPEFKQAIADKFDAVGKPDKPHTHGTGMAGAIVAQSRLMGVAPGARTLAVHAFSSNHPANTAGDHAGDHRGARMGAEQGRARHQHELRRPLRPDAGAGDEESVGKRRGADRGRRQRRAEVAAALSRRRSARHRRHRRSMKTISSTRAPMSARRSRSRRPAST